jgi:hypothetical protein
LVRSNQFGLNFPLFYSLNPEVISLFVNEFEIENIGEIITISKEDDQAKKFYFIAAGTLSVTKRIKKHTKMNG